MSEGKHLFTGHRVICVSAFEELSIFFMTNPFVHDIAGHSVFVESLYVRYVNIFFVKRNAEFPLNLSLVFLLYFAAGVLCDSPLLL